MNFFGVMLVRKYNSDKITKQTIRHEMIHTAQMKELLYIGFYLLYFLEWLFNCMTKPKYAYRSISFEVEARSNDNDADYLTKRKHFAQWRKDRF